MELKLVYRWLRKTSDFALEEFYSEVLVEGSENVPQDRPIIVASCHHNEIIDIATMSVTIPQRRHVSFWAKASLFKNPMAAGILSSSGAIPVYRSPDRTAGTGSTNSRESLFRETFQALADGQVIGVFPEGSSYTEPCLPHLKDGASWAALEYARWEAAERPRGKPKGVVIVPVGILYTDKGTYQSKVIVRWGKPIDADRYLHDFVSAADHKGVVREVTKEIDRQLVGLTLNAPNWDVWHAAGITRDILWESGIPLEFYSTVSQSLCNAFAAEKTPSPNQSALVKYASLLHHTHTTHAELSDVLRGHKAPSAGVATILFFRQLLTTTLHPRFFLFIPPLLVHLPAFVTAKIALRLLYKPGEDETKCQIQVFTGGFALGTVYALLGMKLAKAMSTAHVEVIGSPDTELALKAATQALFTKSGNPILDKVKGILVTMGVIYVLGSAFNKWHRALITSNYRQYKNLITSFKVMIGLMVPKSYETLPDIPIPPPAANPYIQSRAQSSPNIADRHVPFWRVMGNLLVARREAISSVKNLVGTRDEAWLTV